jgi:hypothetical protein
MDALQADLDALTAAAGAAGAAAAATPAGTAEPGGAPTAAP